MYSDEAEAHRRQASLVAPTPDGESHRVAPTGSRELAEDASREHPLSTRRAQDS